MSISIEDMDKLKGDANDILSYVHEVANALLDPMRTGEECKRGLGLIRRTCQMVADQCQELEDAEGVVSTS